MVDGKVDDDVARCVPEAEEASPMDAEDGRDNDDDYEDDDDEDPVTEIRFVPADENQLDRMFAVMSDCQALHPDSDEENLSDEDYGEEEEGEEEEGIHEGMNGVNGHGGDDDAVAAAAELAGECPTEDEMTPQGLATLRRLEGMLGGGGGDGSAADAALTESSGAQFEDADDMES